MMSRQARPWSEREDATLAKIYPSAGIAACEERLGRTRAAIYARAFTLGLTSSREAVDGEGSGPALDVALSRR